MLRSSGLPMLLIAAIVIGALAACGEDDDVEPEQTLAVPQDTAPAPSLALAPQPEPRQPLDEQASPAEDGIISIEARDLKFAPNRWTAALAETVTIRLTNGDAVQHNFRLAGPDGEYNTQDDAVTVPEAISGGETGEVTFAPQVSGGYTFRCDFHPDAMGGRIEVR